MAKTKCSKEIESIINKIINYKSEANVNSTEFNVETDSFLTSFSTRSVIVKSKEELFSILSKPNRFSNEFIEINFFGKKYYSSNNKIYFGNKLLASQDYSRSFCIVNTRCEENVLKKELIKADYIRTEPNSGYLRIVKEYVLSNDEKKRLNILNGIE